MTLSRTASHPAFDRPNLLACLLLFASALLLASCSTSLRTKVLQEGTTLSIQEELDVSSWEALPQRKGLPVVSHEIKKTNYLFFSRTSFHFRVGQLKAETLPEDIPLTFVALFRGKVLKTNAARLEPQKAIWELKQGQPLDLFLETYTLEILPISLCIGLLLLLGFARRKWLSL